MAGISTPIFWLGAVLLYLLTFKWHASPFFHWLPSGGYVPLADAPSSGSRTCSCRGSASRSSRSASTRASCGVSLLQTQSADYVRTARAMGLPRWRVLLGHTLRTALLPIASLFALDFGAAVGGTVILIEPVFGINGVGAYAQQSVAHLDLPPLMALTLYGGFLIVIVNAVADLAYSRLDPRIRLE